MPALCDDCVQDMLKKTNRRIGGYAELERHFFGKSGGEL